MFKTLTRDIVLAIQAENGLSTAVAVWSVLAVLALLAAFVFLSIAGYLGFAAKFGGFVAALIMAGIFVAIALIAVAIGALVRRRVRERAILARAAKARSPSWLLDPKVLGVAVEAGRSIGWQRLVPVALVAILAAQWAREKRDRDRPHA